MTNKLIKFNVAKNHPHSTLPYYRNMAFRDPAGHSESICLKQFSFKSDF